MPGKSLKRWIYCEWLNPLEIQIYWIPFKIWFYQKDSHNSKQNFAFWLLDNSNKSGPWWETILSAAFVVKPELWSSAPKTSCSPNISRPNPSPQDIEHEILSSLCAAACDVFTANVESATPSIKKNLLLPVVVLSSHRLGNRGSHKNTRHPSSQSVTSSQQEAFRAMPLCSFSPRPTQNVLKAS